MPLGERLWYRTDAEIPRTAHRVYGPANSPGAESEIDRCFRSGLRGIGEIFPTGQDFDIGEAKDTTAFAAACKERGLPVIVHGKEPLGHDYAGKTNTPLRRIERFIGTGF